LTAVWGNSGREGVVSMLIQIIEAKRWEPVMAVRGQIGKRVREMDRLQIF
jgi:hypothetical protein